jgi:hypothetical protein
VSWPAKILSTLDKSTLDKSAGQYRCCSTAWVQVQSACHDMNHGTASPEAVQCICWKCGKGRLCNCLVTRSPSACATVPATAPHAPWHACAVQGSLTSTNPTCWPAAHARHQCQSCSHHLYARHMSVTSLAVQEQGLPWPQSHPTSGCAMVATPLCYADAGPHQYSAHLPMHDAQRTGHLHGCIWYTVEHDGTVGCSLSVDHCHGLH